MTHRNGYALWLSLGLIGCSQPTQDYESKRTTGSQISRSAWNRPAAESQTPGRRPSPRSPTSFDSPSDRSDETQDPTTVTFNTPAGGLESLTLGAYNLLRLGYGTKDQPRMVQLIIQADYDLFAAVEIMKVDAAEDLLSILRETGQPWEMLLSLEAVGEYSYKEYFAFYYRSDRVSLAYHPEQFCNSDKAELTVSSGCFARDLRLDDGNPDFEREPFIGHFEVGGQLVTVAAVHTFYGERSENALARRRHEMQGLLRVVDEIEDAVPETNVFVTGDFNLVLNHNGRGLDESIPEEFYRDLIGLIDGPTTIGFSNYDHIFYLRSNEMRLKDGTSEIILDFATEDLDLRTEYKENISDHYPVKAAFSWIVR